MVIESWLNAQVPNHQRGQVFAVYMTVTLLALALGQYLILLNNIESFIPFALITVLFSLGLVPVAVTRVLEPPPIPAPRLSLRRLFNKSPLGVLGTMIAGLVVGAFWGMGAVFTKEIGLPNEWIAAFMSTTILGGAILQFPIGRISDGRDRRGVLLFVSLMGAGLAMVAFGVAQISPLALVICTFFYGGFTFPIYALCVAHMNDYLEPEDIMEATSGLLMIYGVGAALGPAAAGVAMHSVGARGLPGFFAVFLVLLSLVTFHYMRARPPVPAEEQGEFVPMVRTSQVALEMHPEAEVEPELDLQ
jgi:MFS family permease